MPFSSAGTIAPRHSINIRIMAACLVLALVGLAFAGLLLRDAALQRDQYERAQATSEARSLLSHAVIEMAHERGQSELLLELPEPITATQRQALTTQRQETDVALQRVFDFLATQQVAGQVDLFRREVTDLRTQLSATRQALDGQLPLPMARRDPAQVAALPRAMKDLGAALQAKRHLLRGLSVNLPAAMVLLEMTRDLAWKVREFGGQERTFLLLGATTGSGLSPVRLAQMDAVARRASEAMEEIRRIASHAGLPEAPRQAARQLSETYFGSYAQLRQAMLAEAAKPVPAYPVDTATFQARSNAALEGAEALSAAANAAINTLYRERQADAFRDVVLASLAVLLILATAGIACLLIIRAFRRLKTLQDSMGELAAGDTALTVPYLAARDEVGAMARALEVFRTQGEQKILLEAAAATQRAARERRAAEMDRHTREFGAALSGVMARLSAAAGRMSETASGIAVRAEETTREAETTAQAASGAVTDLGSVAAATEELTASVGEISRQAANSAQAAQMLAQRAQQADTTMTRLNETATTISEVARLIGDIAGQTNLLALNATIEAARAGEAGKGFAVVANEVKALASQTAKATEQIAGQIQAIQSAAEEAVGVVRGMAGQVSSLGETATAIAAAVEQQGAATREISASVATVLGTSQQTVVAMEQAADSARRAREASSEVQGAAGAVSHETKELGSEVDQFLNVINDVRNERRGFERIAGDERPVSLALSGGLATTGRLQDLSRGGLAIRLDGNPPKGLEPGVLLRLEIRGAAALEARVARVDGAVVGLVVKQDDASASIMEGLVSAMSTRQAA